MIMHTIKGVTQYCFVLSRANVGLIISTVTDDISNIIDNKFPLDHNELLPWKYLEMHHTAHQPNTLRSHYTAIILLQSTHNRYLRP